MKIKTTLAVFFLFVALVVGINEAHSERDAPPSESAGEPPASTTCAQEDCHPGPALESTLDNLLLMIGSGSPIDTLNIPSPTFRYKSNTSYNMAFMVSSFTGRYGFQIVALKNSDNNRAGVFSVTDNINTQITSLGQRQYLGHKNAGTYKNWTFNWTSPDTSTGPVTFYYAYNTADANDTSTNDVIYKGTVTISPDLSTGIASVKADAFHLNIFPNPVEESLNVNFLIHHGAYEVSAKIYSMDGKLVTTLVEENLGAGLQHKTWNVDNLDSGLYLLKLEAGPFSSTRKFMKL